MPYPCAVPGINLSDYSLNAAQRGWGQPCGGQLATVLLTQARVSVDARVAELVGLIMRINEAQGYLYRQPDTGAYNCRHIGSNPALPWSNHAWGLAIDSNWQTNPMAWPLRTDRPQWEIQRWNRFGFAWGGHYTPDTPPDAMHVEAMGTPAQMAQALLLARSELSGTPAPAPAPQPAPEGWHAIPMGGVSDLYATGAQVARDQADLNDTGFYLPADGYWGLTSVARAKEFQLAAGATTDGKFGPASRAKIHMVPSWHGGASGGGYSALVWQQALKAHGWHIETDGVWGTHSAGILKQFQVEKHVHATGQRDAPSWVALHCQPG